jgi:lipoprotein-releasing system permease protein
MAQGGDKIRSASLRGYDFSREFPYSRYVVEGSTLLNSGEVIIGHYLAQDLGLGIGDGISLIYPQFNRISAMGMYSGQQRYRVAGIYRSGFYENDRSIVITTIPDAEALLLISDSISRIEVRLKDADRADHFSRVYMNLLGEDYFSLPWTAFASSLMRLIAMEKWLIFIIFCFLVLIAGINVVSAVSTIILDKKAEIAVLKSLGANSRVVKSLYAYKVGIIAMTAVIVGQAFGALLSWIVEKQGIYKLKGDVYFIDTLGASITPFNLLAVFAVSTILIWLCIRIPLKQIDRLQIIDLIRQKA